MKIYRLASTGLLFLALFVSVLSGRPMAALSEDELQAGTKEVAKTLRCAVCQSESVWESNAELALQMREIIREKLQEGETPDQIRAYFVSRYGDFILLKPRTFGLNWVLWAGPFLLLILGALFLIGYLKLWTRKPAPAAPGHDDSSALSEDERNRIERELRIFRNE